MDNIYLVALSVSFVFFILKLFEIRFILKEKVNIKQLFIDTFIIYFSVIIGIFVMDQFEDKGKNLTQAPVFIDNPKF